MPASKTEDRNLKTTFLPDWRLRVTVQLSTALGHIVTFHTKRTCNSPKTWTGCTLRRQATRTRAPYRHSCCICLVPCFPHSQCVLGHDGENARHLLLLKGKGLVCVFLFIRQHHVLARATKQCSWCINLTACSSHNPCVFSNVLGNTCHSFPPQQKRCYAFSLSSTSTTFLSHANPCTR